MAQRRPTLRELRESEQKLKAIFENTPAGLLVTDYDGNVVDCNRRFTEIFGTTKEDYVGVNVLARMPEGAARQNLVDAAADGRTHRYQGPYRSITTGREFHVVATCQRAAPGLVFTVIEDVTERVEAEQELRASEEKYRRVFDNDLYPMVLIDLETLRIIDANEALVRLYGYARDELLGGMVARDLTAEPEASRRLFEELGRSDSAIVRERYHRKKDGTVFPVEFFIGRQPVAGRTAALAMIRDITERRRAEEELRLQTSRLSSAMEASSQGWFDLDVRTGVARVSAEWARRLGYEPKELSTRFQEWLEQVHPDDRAGVRSVYEEGVAQGRSVTVEYRRRTQSGGWKWIRSIGKVVEADSEGRPLRMTGVHADISDLKEKEDEVRETYELLRTVFNSSPVYMSVTDLVTGKIIDANEACTRFLGIPRRGIIGKTSLEINVWGRQEDRDRVFGQLRAGGEVNNLETLLRTSAGEKRHVLLSCRRIEVAGGPAILTSVHDITERKRYEEALRQSEADAAQAQRVARIGNWKLDIATNELSWSKELYRIFDLPEEGGGSLYEAFLGRLHPEDAPKVAAAIDKATGIGEPIDVDYRVVARDGSLKHLRGIGAATRDGNGAIIGLFGVAQDITESKRAEEALQRAKDELEERVRERTVQLESAKRLLELDIERRERADLERARLEAQLRQSQTLEAVGRLAGGVAHDFNNLLASVLACAWVAGTPAAKPGDVRRELRRIQELCKQGGEVTRQLLTVARQTKGRTASLDLRTTLRQVRLLIERACPKTVSVVFEEAPDLPHVSGDRGLLTTALLNVCLNARDAMPGGGRLTVRAWREEGGERDWAVVDVSDTGEGISEELRAQIFQPFFSTKGGGRGAGLGLPMALAAAENMGGSLDFSSGEGEGATFRFRLPACSPAAEASASPGGADRDLGSLGLAGRTVLVVEDEDDVARFLVELLSRYRCGVLRARTGLEALEVLKASEDTLALILLDLVLPEISGATVYRALAVGAPHIPVVIMTGRDDLAAELGPGVPVLKKPFSDEDLTETLCRVVLGGE